MKVPIFLLPLLVTLGSTSDTRRCVPFFECPSGNIVTKELRGPGSTDVCCIVPPTSSVDVNNVDVRLGFAGEERCVPFFECPKENIVRSGVSHVCCDYGSAAAATTPTPTAATTPSRSAATTPAPSTPACSTRGTPDGLCMEVAECLTDLREHLNNLSFAEFVARFGCGRERPGGNVRVCCPRNA